MLRSFTIIYAFTCYNIQFNFTVDLHILTYTMYTIYKLPHIHTYTRLHTPCARSTNSLTFTHTLVYIHHVTIYKLPHIHTSTRLHTPCAQSTNSLTFIHTLVYIHHVHNLQTPSYSHIHSSTYTMCTIYKLPHIHTYTRLHTTCAQSTNSLTFIHTLVYIQHVHNLQTPSHSYTHSSTYTMYTRQLLRILEVYLTIRYEQNK